MTARNSFATDWDNVLEVAQPAVPDRGTDPIEHAFLPSEIFVPKRRFVVQIERTASLAEDDGNLADLSVPVSQDVEHLGRVAAQGMISLQFSRLRLIVLQSHFFFRPFRPKYCRKGIKVSGHEMRKGKGSSDVQDP